MKNKKITLLLLSIISFSIVSYASSDFETMFKAMKLLDQKKYDECIEIVEVIIDKNPNPGFYITLVQAYIGKKEYTKALNKIKQGQKALKKNILPNGKSLFDFDDVLIGYKLDILTRIDSIKYESAIDEINQIFNKRPISQLGSSIYSLFFIRNDDYKRALSLINNEISNDSLDILMFAIRSYASLKQKKFNDFINDWEYIKEHQTKTKLYYPFEYNRTLEHIEIELQSLQENEFLLSVFYYLRGDISEAVPIFEKAMDKYSLKSEKDIEMFIRNSKKEIPINNIKKLYHLYREEKDGKK